MKAILLNSGMGSRLKQYTKDAPKTLVELTDGQCILSKAMNILDKYDIEEYIITTGYKKDKLVEYIESNYDNNFTFIHNKYYDSTNYIKSMDYIDCNLDDDVLLMHGDLIFDSQVLDKIIKSESSSVIVDTTLDLPEKDFKAKLVDGYVKHISIDYFGSDAVSLQPLYKLTPNDWLKWKKMIRQYCSNGDDNVYAEEALNKLLADEVKLEAVDIKGYYCREIDTVEDLENYRETFK